MLPFDMTGLLHRELLAQRREPDGLLHASSDLVGSLRHAQLHIAGAPKIASEVVSDIRLMTGTMWHEWLGKALVKAGIPFMQEVKVTPWLPDGWSGTADWIIWDAASRGFVLGDLKTIKGEGMRWIESGGAKNEHLWQVSAYWHALYDAGFPLVRGFAVLYWPMNDTTDDSIIEPQIVECDPLPRETVYAVMEERWALTERYLAGVSLGNGFLVTEELAPEMQREQKLSWNAKQSVFDLKLVPHWSTAYCPYADELCSCNTQGTTKIGHYTLEGEYVPREGYELELVHLAPSERDYQKRRVAA